MWQLSCRFYKRGDILVYQTLCEDSGFRSIHGRCMASQTDAFSSVGSLIGIGGAMLGFPVLDPLASVVICIFILKVAFDIFKDALDKMLDTSCSEEYEEKLADYIRKSRGVERLDLLRTRMFGNKVYIDAEIAVDGTLSLKDAHAIAEDVHDNVEKKFPNTKHIMIHVNPA